MRVQDILEVRFGALVLALHCYSGDEKQNMDFFQMTCFKESKNMGVEKNLRVTINFYQKYAFQLSYGIKTIYRSKLY